MDLDNKTLTLFKSFLSDICKVFPEYKECIDKNYSEILELTENSPSIILKPLSTILLITSFFRKS